MEAVELHKAACRAADRQVPEFEIGTPQHRKWIDEYVNAAKVLIVLSKSKLWG